MSDPGDSDSGDSDTDDPGTGDIDVVDSGDDDAGTGGSDSSGSAPGGSSDGGGAGDSGAGPADPTPTPVPTPADAGAYASAALSDATDEPGETDVGIGQPPSAVPSDFFNPFTSPQNGWPVGSQTIDRYADATSNSAIAAFVGRDINPYTNVTDTDGDRGAFSSNGDSKPFINATMTLPYLDDAPSIESLMLSFGMDAYEIITTNVSDPTSSISDTASDQGGSVFIGTVIIDGAEYARYQDIGGTIYEFPVDPAAVGSTWSSDLVPDPRATIATADTRPPAPVSDGVSLPPETPGAPSALASRSETTWFGDLLAGVGGLFGPTSVAPYMHPQTPANLPTGLQRMGQMNGQMAQQSLQDASARTRNAIIGAGAPYVATQIALAAPAVGSMGIEGSLMAASRFPKATMITLDIGNALTGTTLPRVAVGAGGAALVASAGQDLPAFAPELPALAPEVPALAPELRASVSAASTEAAALFQARDEAAEVARKMVSQELSTGQTTPARAAARFGTLLDALAKTNIRQAISEGRLPDTFVTSPTVAVSRGYQRAWIGAPDAWDTATGRAWDFMPTSEASFYAHENKYLGELAASRLDPVGTVITEILPLFHMGF
ncbi:MAG TPA: hypothetical protein VGM26_12045 [Rhizomicrobium sp.]|jgi:hypothetical protein